MIQTSTSILNISKHSQKEKWSEIYRILHIEEFCIFCFMYVIVYYVS